MSDCSIGPPFPPELLNSAKELEAALDRVRTYAVHQCKLRRKVLNTEQIAKLEHDLNNYLIDILFIKARI